MSKVEWGEYRLGDLFEVLSYKKRFDANKVTVSETGKYPYIVRMGNNNGQKGFIDEDEIYLNEGNTISFGQDTATMFYQENPYFTGDKIKVLKPKFSEFAKQNAQFFIVAMHKPFSNFSWGTSSFNVEIIKSQKIALPIKNNKIDFDFMEDFIAELEAYLSVAGLKDTHLSFDEEQALSALKNNEVAFEDFTYESIFNHIAQGRRLKKDDQLPGDIPFVMAGVTDTGIANYVSNPIAVFPANSITIDILGNTFYRSYRFGAGDDTGAYWSDEKEYSKNQMLFLATAMGMSVKNKFSYGHKLRSSKSYNFEMKLPIKKDKIDFMFMESLISAIKKSVIKDVVKYSDEKIIATKKAVESVAK